MLKEILERVLKNVEEGEIITPIDTFTSKNVFSDKDLKHKAKVNNFEKGDEFEVHTVTPHEIVCYVKNKDLYIVIDKLDLKEFEDLD